MKEATRSLGQLKRLICGAILRFGYEKYTSGVCVSADGAVIVRVDAIPSVWTRKGGRWEAEVVVTFDHNGWSFTDSLDIDFDGEDPAYDPDRSKYDFGASEFMEHFTLRDSKREVRERLARLERECLADLAKARKAEAEERGVE